MPNEKKAPRKPRQAAKVALTRYREKRNFKKTASGRSMSQIAAGKGKSPSPFMQTAAAPTRRRPATSTAGVVVMGVSISKPTPWLGCPN